ALPPRRRRPVRPLRTRLLQPVPAVRRSARLLHDVLAVVPQGIARHRGPDRRGGRPAPPSLRAFAREPPAVAGPSGLARVPGGPPDRRGRDAVSLLPRRRRRGDRPPVLQPPRPAAAAGSAADARPRRRARRRRLAAGPARRKEGAGWGLKARSRSSR